jgi:hypothetical protein
MNFKKIFSAVGILSICSLLLAATPVIAARSEKNLDLDGNGEINGYDLVMARENKDSSSFNSIIKIIDINSAISELTLAKEMVDQLAAIVSLQIELTKISNPDDTETIDALTAQLLALENKSETIREVLITLERRTK